MTKYWSTLPISQQGHKEDDLSMVFAIIYNPSFISWTGRVLNLGLGSRLRGGGGYREVCYSGRLLRHKIQQLMVSLKSTL